jgi:Protein of unknown function (DUF3095)
MIAKTTDFFIDLPAMRGASDTFNAAQYRPAPDDWIVAVSDVKNSTGAIERGLYKSVNFVAAASIAALKNLAAPVAVPFLFGGDGSVVLIPPDYGSRARQALARLRGWAAREFGLELRVGAVAVTEIRRLQADILVGRYEPTKGNNFGVFLGGGVGLLERAVKGLAAPQLAALAAIADGLDDGQPIDLTGLSCRWHELGSTRGKMVSIIIHGARDATEVYGSVMQIASQNGDPRPVRLDTLAVRWPPAGFLLEAHARRRRRPLAVMAAIVLFETLISTLVITANRRIGSFDPRRYRQEVTANTDFSKYDETISFVIDCSNEGIEAIRQHLSHRAANGELRYGMHLSDTALMTCLVTSLDASLHVHFIDGGSGGYTNAAKQLKAYASVDAPHPSTAGAPKSKCDRTA